MVIYALGSNTIDNASDNCLALAKDAEFRQVWRPYIWYSLYVYALWGGMFIYFVYCVSSSAGYDRKWIQKNKALLLREMEKEAARADSEAPQLEKIESLFQYHSEAVHDIVQRYAVINLVLVLALVHESFLAETVTLISHELAKWAIGIMLLSVAVIMLSILMPYAQLWRKIDIGSETLKSRTSDAGVAQDHDRWIKFRRYVKNESSPGKIVRGIFTKGVISIPLVVSVAGYVSQFIGKPWDWYQSKLSVIVPEGIIDGFGDLVRFLGSQSPY